MWHLTSFKHTFSNYKYIYNSPPQKNKKKIKNKSEVKIARILFVKFFFFSLSVVVCLFLLTVSHMPDSFRIFFNSRYKFGTSEKRRKDSFKLRSHRAAQTACNPSSPLYFTPRSSSTPLTDISPPFLLFVSYSF